MILFEWPIVLLSQFVGVFTDGIPPNPAANQSSNTVLPEIIITAEDVENEIKLLTLTQVLARMAFILGSFAAVLPNLVYP